MKILTYKHFGSEFRLLCKNKHLRQIKYFSKNIKLE